MVMMVVGLAFITTGMVASVVFFHCTVMSQNEAEVHARQAAESANAACLERLMYAANTTPTPSPPPTQTLQWAPGEFTALGRTTFNKGVAVAGFGVPTSVANFTDAWMSGPYLKVPPYSFDLIGVGRSGNAFVRSEELISWPPYPNAIVSAGPIVSTNGLIVAGVRDASAIKPDISLIPRSQVQPADMASNSPLPFFAVQVAPNCQISGDVQACGGIRIPPTAVAGATQAFAGPAVIPQLPVKAYNPPSSKVMGWLPSNDSDPKLEGYNKAPMGYAVDGNLTLDSALLYVDGDLTISGAILGNGAIFVTGSTTIQSSQQASDLSTSSMVALASIGDVTLTGQVRTNNMFRGVVYTEGNFTASHITLMGSFVAQANASGNPTQMTLNDVDVLHVPDYMATTLTVPLPQPAVAPTAKFAGKKTPTDVVESYMNDVTYDPKCCYWVQGSTLRFDDPTTDTAPSGPGTSYPCFQVGGQFVPGKYHFDPLTHQVVFDTTTEVETQALVDSFITPLQANADGTNNTVAKQTIRHDDPTATLTQIEQDIVLAILMQLESDATTASTAKPGKSGYVDAVPVSWNQFMAKSDQMRVLMWRQL
jgi:hypothetical protein